MAVSRATAYWVREPGRGELRAADIPPKARPGHSLVRAAFTGVSVGTERLVGRGNVPPSCAEAMSCQYMAGSFDLPVKYGYCAVGTGVDGDLAGLRVFVMHPHQDVFEIANEHATEIRADVPTARASLIPNLETALNAVWDAELAERDSAVVVGAGAVGLLISYVLWRSRGVAVAVIEPDRVRRSLAESLPWVERTADPQDAPVGAFDVAFHTSGNGCGLQVALDSVGFEGRVVELSWYGSQQVSLDLGAEFHFQRKRILASQVGAIAPSRRGSHDFKSRVREVVDLLDESSLDQLLGEPVAFDEMASWMDAMYAGATVAPIPTICYPEA